MQEQLHAQKEAHETATKKGVKAEVRKAGPKRTLVGSRQPPETSDEQRPGSSDGSWVRTGRVPIDESTDGEQDKALYNANLTPEEMKLINDMRQAKADEEK